MLGWLIEIIFLYLLRLFLCHVTGTSGIIIELLIIIFLMTVLYYF